MALLLSISGLLAIVLNVAVRLYSALYMIISDCDETFNYWEPLNLLTRGFGKQTWEYSPEYSIRSYAYLIPYYLVNLPFKYVAEQYELPAYHQFYWLRIVALCGFTSYSEYKLYRSLNKNFNKKVANWYLFLSSVAPGMSHAGVALLPSSLAMNCVSMATSYILSAFSNPQLDENFIWGIFWFLVGGLFGWPFELALAIPFGLYTLRAKFSQDAILLFLIKSIFTLLSIAAPILIIDSYFYQKFDFVPLNIVFYNVFGGEGEGPEIFGVEPFSYYILNLLLNFNIIFFCAFIGLFVNAFIIEQKNGFKTIIGASLPLLIWSIIFGTQPHKEERFLYPIYPLIALNASIFLSKSLPFISNICGKIVNAKGETRIINRLIHVIFTVGVFLVSISRILSLVENYSAPLSVSQSIGDLPSVGVPINVCIAREWYHFPTSFFLPDNYRLQFVKSGFDGLLPGNFLESDTLTESTSSIPFDMNNKNLFSESKVIDIDECSYYIDNDEPTKPDEPHVIGKDGAFNGWEVMNCKKIINPSGQSAGITKYLWVPIQLRKYLLKEADYMEFCALKRVQGLPL